MLKKWLKNLLSDYQNHEEIPQDINALLAEYSAIKAEETACEQTQITLVTSVFSFIAAVLGINCFFGQNINEVAAKFLILGFCPLLVMFYGCLWMYQLYCHMRFGAYLYHIEEDINKYYLNKDRKIYFDHWIIAQEQKQKFFLLKPSWLYGCITLGTWLAAPLLLVPLAGCCFPDWNIRCFYLNEHEYFAWFLGFVFIVYYFTQIMYVYAILKMKSQNELKKPRISKDS